MSRTLGVCWRQLSKGVAMFRFTVRDILWLTVVVALGIVCWQHRDAALWEQRAKSALRALEDRNFDTQWHQDGILVSPVAWAGGKFTGRGNFYRSSGLENPESKP
jgi:hypothetical protein